MLTPTSGTLADYNTAILDGNPTHIKIEFPVQNVTLLDSDISSDGGVVISSIMNTDTDLTIGKAVSSELVCSFLNGSKFTGFDWTEECKVSIGVDISGTTNWVTVGYFKGQKPDRTVRTDAIQFIAYDRMQAFDVLADDFLATVTYPTTLADIYHDMCTFVGVSYVAGDEIADSLTLSFSESPFGEGLTCRGILAQIAEACGCYARINNAGVVKMTWFTDHTSDYEITADDYFGVNISESTTSVVTHIRVACTFDTSVNPILYPATTPSIVYQILDNPFLLNISSADLTTVLTAIIGRFTTLGAYTPISVEAVGNWMVEDGDIISIQDENSNSYDLPVFGLSLAWNGVCGSGYECTGNTEREPLTSSAKEQYEAGGKVSNKYTIRSGVDIDNDGVTISGGKFLKLISGGVLDVQAQNFVVDSTNKVFEAGRFRADDDEIKITDTSEDFNTHLHIANAGFTPTQGENDTFDIVLKASAGDLFMQFYYWNGQYSEAFRLLFDAYNDAGRLAVGLYSNLHDVDIGRYAYPVNIWAKQYAGDGVANNLTTTTEGKVLDARQGKELASCITNITRSGTTFTATRKDGTTFTFTQQDTSYPNAVTNITRSGTTFTATRANGGTFTFTQQDNNTWRGYQIKDYSYKYTVSANSAVNITGTNLGVSTPSGYAPVAATYASSGAGGGQVVIHILHPSVTGGSTVLGLRNVTSSSQTFTAHVSILYLQTGSP